MPPGFSCLGLSPSLFPIPETPVRAQDTPSRSLPIAQGRAAAAVPDDGYYYVNDDFKFTVEHKSDAILLRFDGDDEIFVLSSERGAVGSRVLKYDTGEVALQVTGYGAVTLYTSTAPGGLPAERVHAGEPMRFPVPATSALRTQARHLADKLARDDGLALTFAIDWGRVDDSTSRYLALDTMRVTARALGGLCADRLAQRRLLAKLTTVRIARGDKPGAMLRNGVLTVTFVPTLGLRGRYSSLAVARAIRSQF